MSVNPDKLFKTTHKQFATPQKPCSKHLSLSKLHINGDMSLKNLRKFHSRTDISTLTDFSYKRLYGPFRVSHLVKILKKAKNLKTLTLNIESPYEKLKFHTLFKAISQLKFKSLTIFYRQDKYKITSNFQQDLISLLKRMDSLETLNLKFGYTSLNEEFSQMPSSFPFRNLTRLGLNFEDINSNLDNWLMIFGKAVGKSMYKNLADPKTLCLRISKDSCPNLSPLGISKYLANFDKIHLTNHVSLKIIKGYFTRKEESFSGYSYGELLLMLLRRQAKFKLNTLEISNGILCRDFSMFTQKNQNLVVNNLHLDLKDDTSVEIIRKNMEIIKLIQPKKAIKVTFPNYVRYKNEDFEPYDDNPYDDDDDEGEGDREHHRDRGSDQDKNDNEGHLLNIVLTPMLAKVKKNMELCLDFSYSVFDEQDYNFLKGVFEDVHQPIPHLSLILPDNVDNDFYPNMDESEIISALIQAVCGMYNVKICTANVHSLGLKYYYNFKESKEDYEINNKSTLEKLIFKINKTQMKPKILKSILKVFSDLPKLTSIDVICSEAMCQACKPLKTIKSKTTGKKITCTFIPESH